MIKPTVAMLLAILGMSAPARAINWEGHDDWLEGAPHAREFERQLKDNGAPLPEPSAESECQPRQDVGKVPENPYEPAPLLCGERRKK
jgi:hypothetical protein